MTDILFIDFETKSASDLKKSGADFYSKHQTTDFLCLGFAFNDENTKLVLHGDPFPLFVREHIENGGVVIAHNAMFEYLIWNNVCVPKYGWPPLKLEQLTCTMAMAYAMALPGSLAMAAPALGITDGKDMTGHRVMMQLSQPRKRIAGGCFVCGGDGSDGGISFCEVCGGTGEGYIWWTKETAPEKYQKLYAYCLKDVQVERELYKRLMPLSPKEKQVWLTDQLINQRGVGVDLTAVKTAIKMVGEEKKRLDKAMREVTAGAVCSCSAVAQLTQWLRLQGIDIPGVAKNHVIDALAEDWIDKENSKCRKALLLRQEAAKASTAKLQKMLEGAILEDDSYRIKGCFQYHGASTGRAAGRRLQFHNMPRGHLTVEQIDYVFELLHAVEE